MPYATEAEREYRGSLVSMVIVVIGVAGSGKTTVGTMLSDALHCLYLEGDSLHSREHIDKMSQGIPLTDADRGPWLSALHDRIRDAVDRGQDVVVACSALKHEYREVLARGIAIRWVFLQASPALIRSRLDARTNHFMKADLLDSQFAALEEPSNALVVDGARSPRVIVDDILSRLPVRPT